MRAAQAERDARAKAAARRERLAREGRVAEAVGRGVTAVLQRLEVSVAAAAEERTAVEQARRGREEELMAVRTTLRDLAKEHDELVNTVHRDEMARAEQRMRIEQLEERALEELGLDLETLVAEYGPQNLVPPSPAAPGEERRPTTRSPSRCRSSARSSRSGCAPPSGPCPCSAR